MQAAHYNTDKVKYDLFNKAHSWLISYAIEHIGLFFVSGMLRKYRGMGLYVSIIK